jgi:hypothetical protein
LGVIGCQSHAVRLGMTETSIQKFRKLNSVHVRPGAGGLRRVSSTRRARPGALASCRAHRRAPLLSLRPHPSIPSSSFPLSSAKGKTEPPFPFSSGELERELRRTTGRLSSPFPPPRHPPPPGPTEPRDLTQGELHCLLLRLRGVAGARHGTSPWSGCFGSLSIFPY